MNPLDIATGALGVANAIGLGIGERHHDKRQLKQQQALTDQQIEASQKLMHIQKENQLDIWNKTNYEAQVKHLNEAGLNPALLYGKGGGGGITTGAGIPTATGGQAANSAATTQANASMGLMLAQMKLIDAQTQKTQAEAEKIRTVDTQEATSRIASIDFQNELNKTIGIYDMVDRYNWANNKLQLESEKLNAEYEAWKAAGFQGTTFDDPNSPMAKAIKAGYEQTVEQLKQTKITNDAKEAENIVKNFEAKLAEQGIHPHSPWWTKLLTDILDKAGIIDYIKK